MPPEQAIITEHVSDDQDLTSVALVASSLRMAIMRLSRRLRAERSDDSLGLSAISALSSVNRFGPLSPTTLAEIERIQPPSMTRVIGRLEERGLVGREPHPTDRRQSVIAITEAGRAILAEDRKRRQAWLARMLEQVDDDDRAKLVAAIPVLERLAQA